jgi:hypothetical protein
MTAPRTLSAREARLELNRNMKAAGVVKPPGYVAHHIVPVLAKISEKAREVLQKFGIDVNGPANGVFLPRDYHNRLHTPTYYRTVNRFMEKAKTRDEALESLELLRKALESGVFPR